MPKRDEREMEEAKASQAILDEQRHKFHAEIQRKQDEKDRLKKEKEERMQRDAKEYQEKERLEFRRDTKLNPWIQSLGLNKFLFKGFSLVNVNKKADS